MEMVDVVDKNDNIIGFDSKDNCHKLGKWHRCAAVYVIDKDKLYLQTRSDNKKIDPGLLDHSASGHVRRGESYEEAAFRELKEELGIVAPIAFVGKAKQNMKFNGFIERQLFEIFICKHNGNVVIDKNELKDVKLFSIKQIKKMIAEDKSKLADGFLKTFEVFSKYIKK